MPRPPSRRPAVEGQASWYAACSQPIVDEPINRKTLRDGWDRLSEGAASKLNEWLGSDKES